MSTRYFLKVFSASSCLSVRLTSATGEGYGAIKGTATHGIACGMIVLVG